MAQDVTIKFRVQDDGVVKFLDKVQDEAGQTGKKFTSFGRKVGAAFAGIAAGAIAFRTLSDAVRARGIQQIAEGKLSQALANVGDTSEESLSSIKRLASELQGVSNVGDEVQLTASAMLLSFKEVGGAQGVGVLLPRLLDLQAGLSSATGSAIDLNQVAASVGKSLTGSASVLKRYGISLTEVEEAQFNAADGMERVNLLAGILDNNFKGLAQATADPFKQLDNTVGDLQETLGQGLRPVLAEVVTELRHMLESERTVSFIRSIGNAVGQSFRFVLSLFQKLEGFNVGVRVGIRQMVIKYREFQQAVVDTQIAVLQGVQRAADFFGFDTQAEKIDENIRSLEIRKLALDAMIQGEEQLIESIRTGTSEMEEQSTKAAGIFGGNIDLSAGGGEKKKDEDRLAMLKKRQEELIKEGKVTQELVDINRELLYIETLRNNLKNAGLTEEKDGLEELAAAELQYEDLQKELFEQSLARAQKRKEVHDQEIEAAKAAAEAEQQSLEATLRGDAAAILSSQNTTQALLQNLKSQITGLLATAIARAVAPLGPAALVVGPLVAAGMAAMFNQILPKFNQGGLFRGRGGVDTNMALLSDGEFVVNRQATADNLPVLESINRGDRAPASRMGGTQKIELQLSGELRGDTRTIRAMLNNLNVEIDATQGSIRNRT